MGKFITVLCFLSLWVIIHCGSLESQNLRNSFATHTRVRYVNDVVSYLSYNYFRSG